MEKLLKINFRIWSISLVLLLPVFLLYFSHFMIINNGNNPTGFIQYDQAYYMANARKYFDVGDFSIFYKSPFSPFYDTPSIYFQPIILFLGILEGISGLDPGIIWVIFGFFSAWICARVALLLYQELVGFHSWAHWLSLIIFFWGGGVLSLVGIVVKLFSKEDITIFSLDPFQGWWFLNFGRNLIFPLEAFHHAIFFLSIFCVIKERYSLSLLLAFLLSISHPFTGIQLILVLMVLVFIERYFLKEKHIPTFFFLGCIGVFSFHVAYYFGYLRLFEEHRILMSQWKLNWTLGARFIPADLLVGGLTIWNIRTLDLAKVFFKKFTNRLLFVWFFVSFILANHQIFISPIQPLHFTRGYTWIPLFFMGAETLIGLFIFLDSYSQPVYRYLLIGLIMSLFLMDNTLWIGSFIFKPSWVKSESRGLRLSLNQKELLVWLNNNNKSKKYVILSQDLLLGYYVTVYTPFRSWLSHHFNTPYSSLRANELSELFKNGKILDIWKKMPVLIVFKNEDMYKSQWLKSSLKNEILVEKFSNNDYTVFSIE